MTPSRRRIVSRRDFIQLIILHLKQDCIQMKKRLRKNQNKLALLWDQSCQKPRWLKGRFRLKLKINQFAFKLKFNLDISKNEKFVLKLSILSELLLSERLKTQITSESIKNQITECRFVWGEPIKKKWRPHKDITYTTSYPSNKIHEMKFQSSEEVSAFLLRNALEIGYCKWQLFEKTTQDKGDHIKITYSCRYKQCDAVLIFNQKKVDIIGIDQNGYPKKYYLARAKIYNIHNHVLKLTRKLASEQNIRQYLFDLPVQQKFQHHVEVIKSKFNLTRCQAKYLKDRVFWRFKDQDHMLRKLSERKVSFRRKMTEKNKSSILLLVSQTMKKNYMRYGDTICFDITYKLLMRKKDESKHLGVGFFIGQDQNSRIILFGLSTIQHQSAQNFKILFGFFFEIVEHFPQTIVTDDQRALVLAIEGLRRQQKYQYRHLLDWYHKIENIKHHTKRQPSRDQLFSLLCRLLKEPSRWICLDILKQIATFLQREQVMFDFFREKEKYILSQVPEKFFAFGISSTRAEAFNRLIKRWVPHQTNIGRLIYFVLRVQKRLNNRMAVLNFIHPELIGYINDEEVIRLSNYLQCLTFQQIRQYYEQSRQFRSVEPGISPVHKYVRYIKYQREYRFNLMYDIKYGCWRCECKNNFRTGMPCAHIVRVVRENKGCIGYYINERWFHDKDTSQVKKPTRPNIKRKKI